MFPKDGATSGACGIEGASSARAPVTAGALGLTLSVREAAEAGRAKVATMPPEMTIAAEALAAGFADRVIAVERDDAGFRRVGAR